MKTDGGARKGGRVMEADHVFCDAGRKIIICDKCGEYIPMPLGKIRWIASVMEAFAEAHDGCKGYGHTPKAYFAEPEPVVTRDL